MDKPVKDGIDYRVRDAYSAWKKLDEIDIKILEGLSLLGPRNLTLIAQHLDKPTSTIRYRFQRMLSKSLLFLHLNPYHTYLGLKKALVFIEAEPGHEDALLDCLRVNNFWLLLCRIYGPYEGCGGIWTIPKGNADDFHLFLEHLLKVGVARSYEINWSTCFEGIPVQSRWFSFNKSEWTFNWDEWMDEVEEIEGDLPITLIDPDDWPIKVDLEDLLIIKELEKDGRKSFTEISKDLDIPLEKVKYHFREHISKRGLIEGYQVEIYRFPSLTSEILFFKFEFGSHEKMKKFALALHDKPFPAFLGKVLGENALITQLYLPKIAFRQFISALSKLIQEGLLERYHYVIEDIFQVWRETIPYNHFKNGDWNYDHVKQIEELGKTAEKWKGRFS